MKLGTNRDKTIKLVAELAKVVWVILVIKHTTQIKIIRKEAKANI